jgi:hypothetical protein
LPLSASAQPMDPPQRIRDKGQQHLPGDEAWLIGEHRASGEKKYYLANLPAATSLRTLAATIKARWICEQAHQQLKEELGLDHFEGRSWQGLHRHALMTMLRLRLPSASSPQKSEAGKKESTDHRLNQACQPCVTPSSRSSLDHHLNVARTAEDGSVQKSCVNKSAKVVLGRELIKFGSLDVDCSMSASTSIATVLRTFQKCRDVPIASFFLNRDR